MLRRTFLKTGVASAAILAAGEPRMTQADGLKPPNILWLSAEDLSPDLGCYGDTYATTPNIDALARRAIRFDKAYSHAGVCAPSRSGIITGMYPTTIGTQHMRCSGIPPAGVKCFPEYLRASGYYCTNNSKTDYQFESPVSAWDENSKNAHWKNRPNSAPFFSVFNFLTTHEGQVRSRDPERLAQIEALGELRHDPAGVTLPPYHADTPATRKDWAQYYDLITLMDREVGEALAELEAAGLTEDTIVWFWGDHGRGLTRCKRWLYESGTRVPLLVHVPEKYRAWVCPAAPDAMAAGINDHLVSFIDFAPTVLSLAGIAPPVHFQGQAFLGGDLPAPREYVYGARDRMDEAYDCIRTVRDKRFRYFRNYMPWLSYAQRIEYMDQMPMAMDLRALHAEGKLDPAQSRWFAPAKPVEELYDVDADPHELNNLAEDPAHQGDLARLRNAHLNWLFDTRDLGLIPEPMMDALKWPNGDAPMCEPPASWRGDDGIVLRSPTPGASVVYRSNGTRQWRLYVSPLSITQADGLVVMACRAGYRDSPEITCTPAMIRDSPVPQMEEVDWRAPLHEEFFYYRLRVFVGAVVEAKDRVSTWESGLRASEPVYRYWSLVNLHRQKLLIAGDLPVFIDMLNDTNPTIQIAAAHALVFAGETVSTVPVLVRNLAHPSQSVRLHAMIALREIGEAARPALPAIQKAAADPWSYVVREAANALTGLGATP
jgi:uncharacterized sulfatase